MDKLDDKVNETGDNVNSEAQTQKQLISKMIQEGFQNLTPQTKQQLFLSISRLINDKKHVRFDANLNKQNNKNEIPSAENEQLFNLLQKQITSLNKTQSKICNTIVQLMSTKKLYHIRQNFRKLVLSILNLQNLQFYVFHDSGRIQFHDLKKNYITQILQQSDKRKLIQVSLANSSQTIQNIDFKKSTIFPKLFQIQSNLMMQQHEYIGQINKCNQKYSILALYTFPKTTTRYKQINDKIFDKIVKISIIEIQQQAQYDIGQFYSKQLLDVMGIIVNQSEDRIKQSLLLGKVNASLSEQQTLIEVIKTISKNQKVLIEAMKYQQFRFELLERVRMYSKYICEENITFMDFDQSGTLIFLVNNRNDQQIDTVLAKLALSDQLCIEKIYPDNVRLQSYIKKAIEGSSSRSRKMDQIQRGMKARIIRNQDNDILRIQVLIQDPIQISQNSCSSSTLGAISSNKKNSSNSGSLSLGKQNKSSNSLIKTIQKQNPGILKDGWLDLFIKDHQDRRKSNIMSKKKRTLFAKSQQNQNLAQNQKPSQVEQNQILKQIDIYTPDTNLLQLNEDLLQPFVQKVFSEIKFFNSMQLNADCFSNFILDLHQGYQINSNPFHNFTHGVNVMHTSFIICSLQQNNQILSPLKLFSTVLSCLCHDVGHTGRTNSFEIASKSKKALNYNDLSPLQNFHASFTFQILRRPQNNFLQKLTPQDYTQIRKDIISNILYTDIKEHFPLIKKFKQIKYKPQEGQLISNEDLRVLTGMITHTSDFGGSAKQFSICKEWSRRVNIQFSAQYKQEAELGIPLTPFFKDLQNQSIMAKNQMGFLKVIVFPLYEVLNDFYKDQSSLKKLKVYAQENIKKWQQIFTNVKSQSTSVKTVQN